MAFVIAQYGAGDPDVMHAEEREVSRPGPGQVLIKQEAVGFNFFDVLQRKGLLSEPANGRVMGIEGAGVVAEVGAGVGGLRVGDRVGYLRSQGAYATERLIEADHLVPLPDDISSDVAAGLIVKGFMAWLSVSGLSTVQRGQTVLVTTAAGGVGSLIVRYASSLGARVIGVVGKKSKRDLAAIGGAIDVAVGLEEAVAMARRVTGGVGVDVVIDGIGADTAEFLVGAGALRVEGTFMSFGAAGGWPTANATSLAQRGFKFLAPQAPDFIKTKSELREGVERVFALHQAGAFGDIPMSAFPLAEAARLHADVEARTISGISILIP